MTLPSWAMEQALKVAETVLRNLPDDYGDVTPEVQEIARALVEAENRGIERAAEVIKGEADLYAEMSKDDDLYVRNQCVQRWRAVTGLYEIVRQMES